MPKKKSLQNIIDQQRDTIDFLMTKNATLLRRAETAEQNEAKADANAERLQNDVIVGLAAFETAMAENRELRRRILHLHEASLLEVDDKVNALVKDVQAVDSENADSFADAIREVFDKQAFSRDAVLMAEPEPEPAKGVSGSFEPKSLYDLPGAPDFVLHFNPPVGAWQRDPSVRGWRLVRSERAHIYITDRELARLKSTEADIAAKLTLTGTELPDGVARVIAEIESYNYRGERDSYE